ncbi:hypothetical protein CYY_006115 [Polysphondylium violaceum]|uniref:Plasminogen receptor (KT) n=1 Tax=Polysphondylium violaceum TaxID=133409 RepID=A0A8J4Q127_9MYCE|nr:hypothetical protein CYY_006115 [Polysphondylium violaceum]
MGNIATRATDNMIEKQKALQTEMVSLQLKNQIQMQDRMMKKQIALNMALTKERTYWFGGVTGVLYLGLLGSIVRGKRDISKLVAAPTVLITLVTAYQWDLAFGNKINRVKKMADEIENNPDYWISPIPEPIYPANDTSVPDSKKL